MTWNTAADPPGTADEIRFARSSSSFSSTSQGKYKNSRRRFSVRLRKIKGRRDSESTCNSFRSGGSSSYSRSSSELSLSVRSTSSSSRRRRSRSKTKLVVIKMTPTKNNRKKRSNVESNVRSADGSRSSCNLPKQNASKRRSKKEMAKIWTSGPQVTDPMAGALFHHDGKTCEEQLDHLVKPFEKIEASRNYNLQNGDDQCNENTENETVTESALSQSFQALSLPTAPAVKPTVPSNSQINNGKAMDIAGISVPTPKRRSTIAKRLLSPSKKRNSPSNQSTTGLSIVSSISSRTAASLSRKSWFSGRKSKMDGAPANRSECIDVKSLGNAPNSSGGGGKKKYRLRKWSKRFSAGFVLGGGGANSKRSRQEEEPVRNEHELEKIWLEGQQRNDDNDSSKIHKSTLPQIGETPEAATTAQNVGLDVETTTTTSARVAPPTKEMSSPTRKALDVEGSTKIGGHERGDDVLKGAGIEQHIDGAKQTRSTPIEEEVGEASDSETSCSPAADNSNDHPLMQISEAASPSRTAIDAIPSEVGVDDERKGIGSQLDLCNGKQERFLSIRPESSGSEDNVAKKKKKRDIFKGIKKKKDLKPSSFDSVTTDNISDLNQGATKSANRSSARKRRRSRRKKVIRVCAMLLVVLGLVYMKFNGFRFFFDDKNDSPQHLPYSEQLETDLLATIPEEKESDMIEEHAEEDVVACDGDHIPVGNSILKRIFRRRLNEIPGDLLHYVEKHKTGSNGRGFFGL